MKPDYYEDFTCIADRCSFTCCREWKIGVDEDTFVKWKHTLTPDGMYDTDRGQQAKKEKFFARTNAENNIGIYMTEEKYD
jgi:lysine-N-methylase